MRRKVITIKSGKKVLTTGKKVKHWTWQKAVDKLAKNDSVDIGKAKKRKKKK